MDRDPRATNDGGPEETDLEALRALGRSPRWPAVLAALAIAGGYALLPDSLRIGPAWSLLAIVPLLLIPMFAAHRFGRVHIFRKIALVLAGVVTAADASSALFLVTSLPNSQFPPVTLLRAAGLIWATNLVTFALLYWEIDDGGPHRRQTEGYRSTDFIFPQAAVGGGKVHRWRPEFVDYLFLAFNTSTAFSPTDTMVISRRAKLLMMAQSLISLLVIAVLAARAINTL
jgi:hypothetical protein